MAVVSREWVEFCNSELLDPRCPDILSVKAFSKKKASAGPTVPNSFLTALRCLELNIGWNFGSADWRLRRLASVPGKHQIHRSRPIAPSILRLLTVLILEENIFIKALACFWLTIVHAVLRPAHAQRSSIHFRTTAFFEGLCRRGKRRVDGVQAPFYWSAPAVSIDGVDLSAELSKVVDAAGCASPESPFLLPDFLPQGANCFTAVGFADVPMSQPKARKLFDQLLVAFRADHEDAANIDGLYSARRLLPSLVAPFAELSTAERVELGGWVDTSAQRQMAMPSTYSESHLAASSRVKSRILSLASEAMDSSKPEEDKRYPSWEDLLTKLPTKSPPKPVEPEEEESSSSSSSSEEDDDPALSLEAEQVKWVLASGRNGHLHLLDEDGELHCRRRLKDPREGSGLSHALGLGRDWSPRCFAALSEEAREQWLSRA